MTHSAIVSARVHFVNISTRLRERRVSLVTLIFVTVLTSMLAVVIFGGAKPRSDIQEYMYNYTPHNGLRRMFPRLLGYYSPRNKYGVYGSCKRPHNLPDNGDCQALGGPRRPSWACLSTMKGTLSSFVKLYRTRPVKSMSVRMRLEACFAVFFMLRRIKPAVVIQTGQSDFGNSIWLIRKALPLAQIISLDPKVPDGKRIKGIKYSKLDFSQVDWETFISDAKKREKTLVLIQDKAPDAYARLFKDNPAGFRHFIFQNNDAYLRGRSNSLKSICEVARKKQWKIGHRRKSRLTWNQHMEQGEHLNRALKIYYEFPPIAANHLAQHKLSESGATSTPILSTKSALGKYSKGIAPWEYTFYGHLAYVEIRN